MVPDDVYGLSGASDPRLDPPFRQHRRLLGVWTIDRDANEYRSNIWLAPIDGSEPPRRFTTGERRDTTARWSPDGSRLAFTSSRKEKEPAQLYVIPVGGGEPTRLTELKEDVGEPVVWSPDGTQIVFAARARDEAYEEEDGRKRRRAGSIACTTSWTTRAGRSTAARSCSSCRSTGARSRAGSRTVTTRTGALLVARRQSHRLRLRPPGGLGHGARRGHLPGRPRRRRRGAADARRREPHTPGSGPRTAARWRSSTRPGPSTGPATPRSPCWTSRRASCES